MEKNPFIKNHTISVGYNLKGKLFFDVLKKYSPYIHSYYFSLTEGMRGKPYSVNDVITSLDCYKNGLNGNLLLNNWDSDKTWNQQIKLCNDCRIIIDSVTVLTLNRAKEIKEKYPDLKIHLSIRYFDWNNNINDSIDDLKGIVDVVNISGMKHYNDINLFNKLHDLGIKVKMIPNESCIVNRHNNYLTFPEFNGYICESPCKSYCRLIFQRKPWMQLTRAQYYKESLKYYDFDIIKLSTRDWDNTENIDKALKYWTSIDKTTDLFDINLNTPEKYQLFLEWCKVRSECPNYCKECMKCKKLFEDLLF